MTSESAGWAERTKISPIHRTEARMYRLFMQIFYPICAIFRDQAMDTSAEPNNLPPRPEKIEADVLAESLPLSHRITSAFRRTFASLEHRDYRIFWSGAWL